MKLCLHNHPMTPENTGRCEYFNRQGRRYTLIYCKQCRRDSSQRFYAKHGRPRRYKKKKPIDEVRFIAPAARIKCRYCSTTTATRELMADHRRRFHSTWDEGRLGA